MRIKEPIFLSFLLLAVLAGCEMITLTQEDENEGKVVARVYQSYLYEEDIIDLVPDNFSTIDSTSFVQNYINLWAKKELMVYKAEFNLQENEKRFEEKIKSYREDLLKFAYLEKYVNENLDTAVSNKAIKDYFNENRSNYLLRENIVQFRYLSVPQEAPKLEKVERLFKSKKEKDKQALKEYALTYAQGVANADSNWYSFSQFASIVPAITSDQQKFLNENKFFKKTNTNGLVFFVEITKYKLKETVSPLSYVENVIANVILNKRRLDLISSLEENLLKDALKKQEFETY